MPLRSRRAVPAVPYAYVLVLLLALVAPPALGDCVPDIYEKDDTCYSAATLLGGQTQSHDFCQDAADWVVFNACGGKTYVLSTANLGPSADTVLELYGPDCTTLLTSNDKGGGGLASRITWVAPASGLYHARVRQADGSTGEGRGYDLHLSGDTSSCGTYSRLYTLPSTATDLVGATTSGGGTFIVYNGYTVSSRGAEPVVAKLDAEGNVTWRKTIGTTHSENVVRAVQAGDDGLVIIALDDGGGPGGWVAKLTAAGQIAWQSRLPADDIISIADMQKTRDGGFVIAGTYQWSYPYDAFLLKLDANGTVQWMRAYDGTAPPDQTEGDDYALAARQMADGGYVLLAFNSIRTYLWDVWLTRVSATGDVMWARGFGPDFYAKGGLVPTSDGGIAVAVARSGSGLMLAKLDAMGTLLWTRVIDGASPLNLMAATADGGVLLPTAHANASLVRFDGMGNVLWQKTYGQTETGNTLGMVDPSPDGGFSLADRRTDTLWKMYVSQIDAMGRIVSCAPWYDGGLTVVEMTPSMATKTLEVASIAVSTGANAAQTGTSQAMSRAGECSCSAPPLYNGTIRVRRVSGLAQVYWTPVGSFLYDVVSGDLGTLGATGGDFTAAGSSTSSAPSIPSVCSAAATTPARPARPRVATS